MLPGDAETLDGSVDGGSNGSITDAAPEASCANGSFCFAGHLYLANPRRAVGTRFGRAKIRPTAGAIAPRGHIEEGRRVAIRTRVTGPAFPEATSVETVPDGGGFGGADAGAFASPPHETRIEVTRAPCSTAEDLPRGDSAARFPWGA